MHWTGRTYTFDGVLGEALACHAGGGIADACGLDACDGERAKGEKGSCVEMHIE